MLIYLYRHGQTKANEEKRYLGAYDEPLSETGKGALLSKIKKPAVNRVYVSPKIRAIQTADILFPNAVKIIVPDLREMHFGSFEMKTAAEMENDPVYREWVDGMCEGRCPGGESMAEFRTRTELAFTGILNENRNSESVHIVAHSGTIRAVMARFYETRTSYWEWNAPFGGFIRMKAEHKNGEWLLTAPEE